MLGQTVSAQSLEKSGSWFSDIEVDSIYSKLLQGRRAVQQFRLATETIARGDEYIMVLEDKTSILELEVINLIDISNEVKSLHLKELGLQREKNIKTAIRWGIIGLGIGITTTLIFIL